MEDVTLWIFMQWMAETFHTLDYKNEWFYQLLDIEDLLVVIGQ